MSEGKQMTSLDAVKEFMFAGKAKFTLRSKKTGTRYTYRVSRSNETQPWFVALMTGTDNEEHFKYMGIIGGSQPGYRQTHKSKVSEDAPGQKAFAWFWWYVTTKGALSDQLEFWHQGTCGKCGRTLTVPESIDRGIGPECAKSRPKLVVDNTDEPELTFIGEQT